MPQLLLQGFPEDAIRIGPSLGVLDKEGVRTYFVWPDNYFSHPTGDADSERFVSASLIANAHVRACEITCSPRGIPRRTLMNWTRQLAEQGAPSFFAPRVVRGSAVMTPEKIAECEGLLRFGRSVVAAAREAGVKESTLRKAIGGGRVARPDGSDQSSSSMEDAGNNIGTKPIGCAGGVGAGDCHARGPTSGWRRRWGWSRVPSGGSKTVGMCASAVCWPACRPCATTAY